jgi:hypothetical protein
VLFLKLNACHSSQATDFSSLSPELKGRHRRGIISRSVILQELIHGLEGLIVPVKNLEIGHGRRCLGPAGVYMGKIRKSASADQEGKSQSASERRTELTAGVE